MVSGGFSGIAADYLDLVIRPGISCGERADCTSIHFDALRCTFGALLELKCLSRGRRDFDTLQNAWQAQKFVPVAASEPAKSVNQSVSQPVSQVVSSQCQSASVSVSQRQSAVNFCRGVSSRRLTSHAR